MCLKDTIDLTGLPETEMEAMLKKVWREKIALGTNNGLERREYGI